MTGTGFVRHVTGDWNPGDQHVRIRIEADLLDQPHDLLIGLDDVQAFITLLLMLSGKAGRMMRQEAAGERPSFPLPINSLGLGETPSGDIVLQMNIGQTTLSFAIPHDASKKLGQSLLALSASSRESAAN